jgi:hypothetical protein
MGPYPPPVCVVTGVYRLTPHPIYLGFSTLCFGTAMALESASGMWLVSPSVALGCTALVLGFEHHEIRARFAPQILRQPLISLPTASPDAPTWYDRVSVVLLVFAPWAIAYEAVYLLGVPHDAIEIFLPFERSWPVLEWTEAIYASAYLFVPAALLVAPTKAALRQFAVTALIATAVVIPLYLTVPIIAPPRAFEPQSVWGQLLLFEREMSNTVAAFPAFHVLWSLIAAATWETRSRAHGFVGGVWALLITLSCVTTGMHAIADLVAAAALFVLLRRYQRIWPALRGATEAAANSWQEWRWGRMRLINHGFYAGLGGFVSLVVTVGIAGPDAYWQLVVVHIAALLGSGLLAQTLEGSSRLSRPFGYYGSLLGAGVATLVVGVPGGNALQLAAAIVLAAPWVQAVGRLRCLVQGCCHGSRTAANVGIRYWRERSRVCAYAELRGVPLHPTPLYSILANFVVGILMLRLWSLEASLSLIVGVYFILTGAARFVEESFRGEPQTPRFAGLRIYQWLALLSFVLGAGITTVPSASAPSIVFWFDIKLMIAATLFALAAAFAMGVDFPASTRRFARLAPD